MPTEKHKFPLGATVWYGRLGQKEVHNPCIECGDMELDRTKFTCRSCNNRGYHIEWVFDTWIVTGPFTVGKVTIENAEAHHRQPAHRQVRYMFHETGVGSGTCYDEAKLYKTREAAERAGKKVSC